MNKKHVVYLLSGSNIGDRASFLWFAIYRISQHIGTITRVSAIYETEPWGVKNQPPYFNQAIQIKTHLSPSELLIALKNIEKDAGRLPDTHMQPRVLDIDILLYDDLQLQSDHLKIPHPQLINRNFAIFPLAEIAPDLVHPSLQETISLLAQKTGDSLTVKKAY
ncbi:MAG TPA: 2-amino-4-hydroxy-6-hydroxymethyldihydropteridine diphosphokinase [Saprospiraceae bacterium]|nr:2-amino-4-hydroxy-6-hydroxymethyldihydropteridine diphosphokinase [Saprospiraceae bacterium]